MGEKKLNDDYYIRAYYIFYEFNYYFMKRNKNSLQCFYDFSFGLLILSFSLVTYDVYIDVLKIKSLKHEKKE